MTACVVTAFLLGPAAALLTIADLRRLSRREAAATPSSSALSDAVAVGLMTLSGLLLTAAWSGLFYGLAAAHRAAQPDAFHIDAPDPVPALLVSGLALGLITNLTLGYRLATFAFRSSRRTLDILPRTARAVPAPVAVLMIALAASALTALTLDWYARFSAEVVVINPPAGFGEEIYDYSQITQIIQIIPSNQDTNQSTYQLTFNDGQQWSIFGSRTPDRRSDSSGLAQFIRLKSELPIRLVQAKSK